MRPAICSIFAFDALIDHHDARVYRTFLVIYHASRRRDDNECRRCELRRYRRTPAPQATLRQRVAYFFLSFAPPLAFAVPRNSFARFLRCLPVCRCQPLLASHIVKPSLFPGSHNPARPPTRKPHTTTPSHPPVSQSPTKQKALSTYAAACSPSQSYSPSRRAPTGNAAPASSSSPGCRR